MLAILRVPSVVSLVLLFQVFLATSASAQWINFAIDRGVGDGIVGEGTSLAIVNGNPAIAYFDSGNGNLVYVRALNVSGTSWGAPVIVARRLRDPLNADYDPQFRVGWTPKLIVIGGIPAIGYSGRISLYYVRALDANGTTWGSPVQLPGISEFAPMDLSLAEVDGNPAFAFAASFNTRLLYMRAADAQGSVWPPSSIVDDPVSSDVGRYNSLAVIDGVPAISYFDSTNGDLKYVFADDDQGLAWNSPVIVDSTGNVGQHTSLLSLNGRPSISYYDATNGSLKYVRASNASGSSWGTPLTPDDTGNVGEFSCLFEVNDFPAIAYYDRSNGNLKYVRAEGAFGTSWDLPITVASGGNIGEFASLIVVNNAPAISHFDRTNGALSYVRSTNAFGSSWNAPLLVDTGEAFVGRYASMALINGIPSIAYYDITRQVLKFIQAEDASGINWKSPVDVLPLGQYFEAGLYGSHCALAEVEDYPAIVYRGDGMAMKYIRALNEEGTAWGAAVPTGIGGVVGDFGAALVMVDGNPAVATDGAYVRSSDSLGANWPSPVGLSPGGQSLAIVNDWPATASSNWTPPGNGPGTPSLDVEFRRSLNFVGSAWGDEDSVAYWPSSDSIIYGNIALAVISDRPAIAFLGQAKRLYFARAENSFGSNWGDVILVDSTSYVGFLPSLATIAGKPAIAYFDSGGSNLRYAASLDQWGTTWEVQAWVDFNGDVGRHPTLLEIGGQPFISYLDATNGDLKVTYLLDSPNAARDWMYFD